MERWIHFDVSPSVRWSAKAKHAMGPDCRLCGSLHQAREYLALGTAKRTFSSLITARNTCLREVFCPLFLFGQPGWRQPNKRV